MNIDVLLKTKEHYFYMTYQVKDLYNEVAVATGFPLYTNATDTPDTNRFLLHNIAQALINVIDTLYISMNCLERTDKITTSKGVADYGLEGIIKNIQYKDDTGRFRDIPFLNETNQLDEELNAGKPEGHPEGYVIKGGYLHLVPTPDKAYELTITVSTKDLVWANNDTSKTIISSIDDAIMASNAFVELVFLKACVLVFARLNNQNAEMYNELFKARKNNFIEHDYKTMEAERGLSRQAGHYNYADGLLSDSRYMPYRRRWGL